MEIYAVLMFEHGKRSMSNIAERTRAEHVLKESETLYRRLFENAQDGILILDAVTGKIVDVNPALMQLTGYSRSDFLGNRLWEIGPFQGFGVSPSTFDQLQGKDYVRYEDLPMQTRDGRKIDVEFVSNVFFVDQQRVIQCNIRDIRTEKNAAEMVSRMVTVVRDSNDAIMIKDFEGRITAWNHGAELMFGYSEQEALRMKIWELVPSNKTAEQEDFNRRLFAGEKITSFETQRMTRDGRILDVWLTVTKLVDDTGKVIGIASTERDITGHKREAEEASRMVTVVRDSNDAITIQDFVGTITDWNHGAELMFGYSEPEALDMNIGRLIPANREEEQKDFNRRLYAGEKITSFETQRLTKEGRVLDVWMTVTRLVDDAGNPIGIASTVRDITERKRETESLRKSNEYLDNLFNYANAPIIVWDGQYRVTRFNHAFEFLTGLRPEDVVGQPLEILFPPSQVEESMALIRKTKTGERLETVEINIRHLDGSIRTILWNSATLFSPDGKTPVATIAQGQDITSRKQSELALRQSAQEMKEKNAELERFLYTVSHDLKSPVVTVRTFLGYLEQDMAESKADRVAKDMAFIRAAADKMAQLLEAILEISRIGRVSNPPARVTLRKLVDEACSAVAGVITKRGVRIQVVDYEVFLCGDRVRLSEIWQNLVENAVKFMGEQPKPCIEIGAETRGEEIVFFVRDNGIGIDPRFQAKIFDLFAKLDTKAEGTGIGLAIVKRVVELYGGRLWVESEGQGKGTCFKFTLPGAINKSKENEGERS
jgi:PAS domain S-box-containing protein